MPFGIYIIIVIKTNAPQDLHFCSGFTSSYAKHCTSLHIVVYLLFELLTKIALVIRPNRTCKLGTE